MQPNELTEAILYELDAIHLIVEELEALLEDVDNNNVSVRDKTAAGAFLAQFYTGIENILKRIVRYYNLTQPIGENWHLNLFELFCEPCSTELPVLFSDKEANVMGPYRRFRHVVHHGYGFQLEWERMAEGIKNLPPVFEAFNVQINKFLEGIG